MTVATDAGEALQTPENSVALAGFGFAALVYGLSEIGARSGAQLSAIIGIGVILVAAFVGYQLRLQRSGSPLMDLRTLVHRDYAVTLTLMAVAFMAFLGSMILLPLYLQDLRALSAVQTGLLVMPGGVAMGLLGPRVGRIYDRNGARPLVIPGAIVMVAALTALSRIEADTSYVLIMAIHIVLMVGLAAIFTPVFTLGLSALPPELYSHGSSLLGTLQQVAGAVGTALLVVIMENRSSNLAAAGSTPDQAFLGGLQWAFVAGAVIGVIVVALSLMLPTRRTEQV